MTFDVDGMRPSPLTTTGQVLSEVLRRLRSSRGSITLGVLVSMLVMSVPVVLGAGDVPSAVELLDRAGWLASEAEGHVVRVNGDTGRVDARVELGEGGRAIDVTQTGSGVFVEVAGELRRVDVRNLAWGDATATQGASFVAGDLRAFLIDASGAVRVLDPVTLKELGRAQLDGRPGRAVALGDTAVVPLDGGLVQCVEGEVTRRPVDVGGEGTPLVGVVGDGLVALTGSGDLVSFDCDGDVHDRASVDVPLDSALLPDAVPAGMAWVVDAGIASGDGASLIGVELGSGDRQTTDLTRDPRRASDLAGPAVVEGRAYMVDRDASEVIEVNTDTGRVVHRERLDIDDASRVEVRGQGDTVFVNDLSSEYAIVIRDGDYTTLDKYTNEGVAVTTPPDDATPPAPAPARTSAPSSPNAPPAPRPGPRISPPHRRKARVRRQRPHLPRRPRLHPRSPPRRPSWRRRVRRRP